MSNAEETGETPRIAVILAGGGGRRMGGADKGAIKLAGRRLVDHVLARLTPQADRILISGKHDYGTGLTVIGDRDDGPRGPAAGLWSALAWIEENAPEAEGFFTAPVDGPFLPVDLVHRLLACGASAVACNTEGVQPTFAYWCCGELRSALAAAPKNFGMPLKELAAAIKSQRITFEDASAFLNINSPEDLACAEALLLG
jgi:molybdopterin-guanine dinucleotide biosynthesis protein A